MDTKKTDGDPSGSLWGRELSVQPDPRRCVALRVCASIQGGSLKETSHGPGMRGGAGSRQARLRP
jgi:hypothetical protein